MTDEQEFFAWLDGELDAEAAARVEARVGADPSLAGEARAHHKLGMRLRAAFDPLMTAPIPDAILTPPRDLTAARERRVGHRLPRWAAMAATLALGLGLGTVVRDRGGQGPVAIEGGRMVAAAELGQALDRQLASVGQSGATRIGLTFRDHHGALCRSFEHGGASGLACRADQKWRIEGLYGSSGGPGGDYRMAAGPDPRLAALIDQAIVGEPFDAPSERAAKVNGWR